MRWIGLMLLFLLSSCGIKSEEVNIGRMMDATVVLIRYDEDSGRYHPSCSGVFISPNMILTAAHCVSTIDVMYYTHEDIMKGRVISPRLGFVEKIDIILDLAVVKVDGMGNHGYVSLEEGGVSIGERVHIVGHPSGMLYTYLPGWVSAIRSNQLGDYRFQINSSAFFGNSGGGAFNDKGHLIGICSSLGLTAPNVTYFVSHRSLWLFLGEYL